MPDAPRPQVTIRPARPEEFDALGRLVADAYAGLPGMPSVEAQPDYYGMLRDVARRTQRPALQVFVAVADAGEPLGCVDFIEDMKAYGTGGAACEIPDAAGIRLLAVRPEHRGCGAGRRLTEFCIDRARGLGRARVILHTTRAMQAAWALYERLGFVRLPAIDFRQGVLEVFGFELVLRERT